MKFPLIRVTAILLIATFCSSETSKRDLFKEDGRRLEDRYIVHADFSDDVQEPLDKEDTSKKENQSEENLPILPPIILLDFGNDTDDENATSEEKSKRTVNGGLGYGLNTNGLQPRRHNYYFPTGKSGTTVSIEESISPFLPKTIIEKVQPDNRGNYFSSHQGSFFSTYSNANTQSQNQQTPLYSNTQKYQFGLRTKPQKSATSFSYQNVLTTPKPAVSAYGTANSGYRNQEAFSTTQSPLAYSTIEPVRYVTQSSFNYVTPGPLSVQRQSIQSNVHSHGFASASQTVETSTTPPLSYSGHHSRPVSKPLSSKPSYTIENGVRYENKIFWKYPDGRVSDVPPATYVETSYPEFPQSSALQVTRSQGAHSIYETTSTENSVLSQGPVQFPAVPGQTGQESNPYISSESLSTSLPQQQVYRLGYQSLVSQKQGGNLAQTRKPSSNVEASYSFSSATSSGRVKPGPSSVETNYDPTYPSTRYLTNSPNPEYANGYVTEPSVNNTAPVADFFGSPGGAKTQSYSSDNDINSYSNLQYSDLLNYNPSISEYIRNPSSILNVHPTFVQAGNSLVPVIILRVDGAAPIQSKTTQNINLKALLQQYLVQYANSIQELARPSVYDLGTESSSKSESSVPGKSPVLDLIRLTQEDARGSPNYSADSYTGRSSYETSNLAARDFASNNYQRLVARQKQKNVQILDEPSFTSYKTKN